MKRKLKLGPWFVPMFRVPAVDAAACAGSKLDVFRAYRRCAASSAR